MATDLTPADPAPVLELLTAFRKSQILFTAVRLGIFDALEHAPKTCVELAQELRLDTNACERLLGSLMMLRLVEHADSGRYQNSSSAKSYLTTTSPDRLLGYVNYSGDVLWKMWDHLSDAIREGSNRWKQTYGWDGPIFSHFFKTEAAKREFLMGMHGYGLISSPAVVNAINLSHFKRFVDLGGATGHLAIAACRRWPNLHGVVFDLVDAVPLAREIVTASDVSQRIDIVAGDFFSDPLPAGDVYALGRILHDWTEAKIRKLLLRIHEHLPAGGAVMICEKLLSDDKASPEWAVTQSLNMLVCTEGQERTIAEYEQLLLECGFKNVTAVRTNSPLDVVLAMK